MPSNQRRARILVVDVAYAGNYGINIPVIADYNQANPQTSPTPNLSLQSRRPIPQFAAITWFNPAAYSTYNVLQVKGRAPLQRRPPIPELVHFEQDHRHGRQVAGPWPL